MFEFWNRLFPKRVLVAVSKPEKYSLEYVNPNKEPLQVTIRLYLTGTKRSYTVSGGDRSLDKRSQALDFWVDTGEFPDEKIKDNFGWILSPRELKKKYLADLIREDVDK